MEPLDFMLLLLDEARADESAAHTNCHLRFFCERHCSGRLIFTHLRCWEVLSFLTIQRQRCIKFRALRAQDFYTPLPLNCPKGQHLPALVVYKNQSPM